MREHDVAKKVAAQYGDDKPSSTGLRKYCPRCNRGGWIFTILEDEPRSVIVWDGKTKIPKDLRGGLFDGNVDVDLCAPQELFRPTFGCGTCSGSKRPHW